MNRVRLALAAVLVAVAASLGAESSAQPQPACAAPAPLLRLPHPPPRFTNKIANGEAIKIIALGSSSTYGQGASSPAASYPSRLQAALRAAFPNNAITVLNRGVNGSVTRDELLRFDQDVVAERPDLVIWQVGTNTLLLGQDMWSVFLDVRAGVRRLNALGADVLLMNMQYSPRVLARANYSDMLDLLAVTGREAHIDVFDRFNIMKSWVEQRRYDFNVFITADGLHMNDWGYDCLARLLAAALHEAARPSDPPK